jgi:hypothetical protein
LHSAAQLYRERFRPSHALREPYLLVAVQVMAAETDAALGDCSQLLSSVF